MNNLTKAKMLLADNECTCVICKGDSISISHLRGVKPLLTWVDEGADFNMAAAADKVVGRATAFLYVILGVSEVYAKVISKPALEVLTQYNISAEYDLLTDNIINRNGDDICPFEKTVLNIHDAHTAHDMIRNKAAQMNI